MGMFGDVCTKDYHCIYDSSKNCTSVYCNNYSYDTNRCCEYTRHDAIMSWVAVLAVGCSYCCIMYCVVTGKCKQDPEDREDRRERDRVNASEAYHRDNR